MKPTTIKGLSTAHRLEVSVRCTADQWCIGFWTASSDADQPRFNRHELATRLNLIIETCVNDSGFTLAGVKSVVSRELGRMGIARQDTLIFLDLLLGEIFGAHHE